MKKVAVILAEGFEEIEALTSVDVLRRAGVIASIVGLNDVNIKGCHNICVKADVTLREMKELDYDAIVLPGGLPGASNLANDTRLKAILQNFDKSNKLICAICAAPMVLESAGVLKDHFVCYPGFEENVRSDKRGYVSDKNVLKDQNIITGKGPAFSMEFALFIVKNLLGDEAYLKVKNDLLYK
ncbi:DJ-1 family glyoxalase III [Campylobacter concisus]|uniref:DJ-1/PfpI family protein (DUF4066 domain) n=1 Tax=Campylobacter concisus TaxID=199 RepID=A0A0M4TLG3_9BACT|nr:DJ-1 family glyoxalase III [Campylobacter concisus]ALF47219.1 DJ-1/PfpI family protein (DUF4066 domain) [Campylobacter concisus]